MELDLASCALTIPKVCRTLENAVDPLVLLDPQLNLLDLHSVDFSLFLSFCVGNRYILDIFAKFLKEQFLQRGHVVQTEIGLAEEHGILKVAVKIP